MDWQLYASYRNDLMLQPDAWGHTSHGDFGQRISITILNSHVSSLAPTGLV